MSKATSVVSGNGLKARFVRSTSWSFLNFGGTQFLRLISNLVLTRLLFPEAFGMMALVIVFMTGLSMFSDTGISAAIQQNKRGDDPDFLDTARTIQIIRGAILWLLTLPLGWMVSIFYEVPLLAWLLPIAGVTLFIDGFKPTRAYSAQRHLKIGRMTAAALTSSVIGLLITCFLAWWLQSIWSLVFGMIASHIVKLSLLYVFLDGRQDRIRIKPEIAWELMHFGKWIFLSTICGFLNSQGDRLILSKYLSLEALGIYNIAFFIASFPLTLSRSVLGKVMLPYLREKPPSASRENFLAFRRIRFIATGTLLSAAILLALIGPFLVSLLYDARYASAGAMVVLIALASLPTVATQGYLKVSLSKGNSRSYAGVFAIRSSFNVAGLLIGAANGGVVGALLGLGLARLGHYPFIAREANRFGAWDPKLDSAFALYGLLGAAAAFYLHNQAILDLLAL